MIQCLKCNRVWPTGTVWCGTCKATLGVKLCPDGHINQPICQCCTTCGKNPLSPFSPCRDFYIPTRIAAGFLVVILSPFLWSWTTTAFGAVYGSVFKPLISICTTLLIISGALYACGGQSGRTIVLKCWAAAFQLTRTLFLWLLRVLKLTK